MTMAESPRANLPVRLASARSIVRPRSVTCGPACRSEPCTLRQLRYAERALEIEPLIVVWAELSVLAHLVGEAMPVPKAGLLDDLARWSPRHRECAVSQAVDAAVAVRTVTFATRLSPDDLAGHVNDAMNRWLISDVSGCGQDGCRRWRIPSSEVVAPRLLTYGTDDPTALETAIGSRFDEQTWPLRLARTLESFVACRWPIRYFAGRDESGVDR
jgi:hypothetical protein